MAQPDPYDRQTSFTQAQARAPLAPPNGRSLDAEFSAVKRCLDQLLANLALIQRDDTQLGNATVGYDQLKTEVLIGINAPKRWAVDVLFFARDTTFNDAKFYICLVPHTAVDFYDDLERGYFRLLIDFAQVVEDYIDGKGYVETVFGRPGPTIVAQEGDYGSVLVTRPDGQTVEEALDDLEADVATLAARPSGGTDQTARDAIAQEIEDRQAADEALAAEDQRLEGLIDDEKAAREAADEALSTRLDRVEPRKVRLDFYQPGEIAVGAAVMVRATPFPPRSTIYRGVKALIQGDYDPTGYPPNLVNFYLEAGTLVLAQFRYTPEDGLQLVFQQNNAVLTDDQGTLRLRTEAATNTSPGGMIRVGSFGWQFEFEEISL